MQQRHLPILKDLTDIKMLFQRDLCKPHIWKKVSYKVFLLQSVIPLNHNTFLCTRVYCVSRITLCCVSIALIPNSISHYVILPTCLVNRATLTLNWSLFCLKQNRETKLAFSNAQRVFYIILPYQNATYAVRITISLNTVWFTWENLNSLRKIRSANCIKPILQQVQVLWTNMNILFECFK